jgi:hypothetical protein
MRRCVQHRTCQPCTTTALDGHVRHGVEGSACSRRTTQRIMHTMHLDGFGQLCSVLICMPRQMTFPYKLTPNSIARSKRNRAPILGSSQRCMLSTNNPHRQHTACRTQRGVPAASNTQRVHRTVRNRQAASRSTQRITCHNVQHFGYNVSPTPPGMPAMWHAASCATCTTKHEDSQHETRRVNATGAHACTPSADTRIAPPHGRRNSPPFARSSSARAADTTRRTGRPCAAGRLRVCNMQRATRADATCSTHRCNMHRCNVQRADATCNARRCNTPTRADALCNVQHASMRHVDATYKAMYCSEVTRADATRNARRCNMHIAHRTAHRVPLAAPGRYVARRSMRAPHRARHPSAVPQSATYHTTAQGRTTSAGRTQRLAVRDRAALERDGATVHGNHAAVVLRTSRRSRAHCNRPSHPARRHPLPTTHRLTSPARTVAAVSDIATASNSAVPVTMESTPLSSCARAHRTAARPPQQPALRPIGQRTRSRHYNASHGNGAAAQPAGRLCGADATQADATLAEATRADATCNARRCNTPTRADATRNASRKANALRCNTQHASHRCNTHRCHMLMQHTRRCIAPMQRETDATRQRAASLHAHRILHPRILYRMHLGGTGPPCGLGTWYASDACILPLGTLATQCMTSAGASCSARRARAAVQHSASRWSRPFANDSNRVLTRSTPAACGRTPYTTRRSMQVLHHARRPSAVPHRATYHTTARVQHAALGARTALVFEIEPPLNVTAPSDMRTTPPLYCAHAGAATPIAIGRRTPSADIRPNPHRRTSPHAPLLRCRILPRRRTARCPCA